MSDDLKKEVETKVLQFLADQILETNRFEFKSKWYNLKERNIKDSEGKSKPNKDYYEFLKDSTAIINSVGGNHGFIIIGVSKEGLVNTEISESGLKDASFVNDILISNVDNPFTVDVDYVIVNEKRLSVIHIPPSTNKPHIISLYRTENSEYKNEIFVRSASGTNSANKGDLDRMYWERGNIIIDKKLACYIPVNDISFSQGPDPNGVLLWGKFNFESFGNKKIVLDRIVLDIHAHPIGYDVVQFVSMKGDNFPIRIEGNNYLLTQLGLYWARGEHDYNPQQLVSRFNAMVKVYPNNYVRLTMYGTQVSGEFLPIDVRLTGN